MFAFRSKNKDKKVEFPNEYEKAQKNTTQKSIESNNIEKEKALISQEEKTSDKENINANSDENLLALASTIVEVW